MAQRRPRSSFGSVPGMPSLQIGTPTKSQYEDFRRRHSRQNKDILKDNLQHKETIQALRAELAAVHVEILEVRKENAALRKRLRETHLRVQDDAALKALDQLLAIMPALQSLRENLDQPLTDGPLMNPAPANASATFVAASIATHPAKTGAIINRLGSLPEGSEVESESDFGDGDAMPGRIKLKGRSSGTGSRATRSPPPAGLRPAIPQPVIRESPPTPSTSSSSPVSIPTPTASPSRPAKVKRRRESGLLLPRRVESPEASGETSDWDEGSQVQLSPEDAQALINDEAEVEAAIEDELREAAIEDELREAAIDDEPPEVTPLVQATSLVQLGDSLPPALDHLGSSPAISATSVAEAALDDDGGRGRRSRRSVNYKEPNLTRKMRKPDGVPAEEALRGGRQSLVASQLPPVETTPASSTSSGTTTNLAPLTASGHLNGMRRKSVLPKSMATTSTPISDDDDDELPWSDESDEFIPGGISRTGKKTAARTSTAANSLLVPPTRNGEERSPTPTTHVVPNRSPPRKTDKKNFPSTLSRPTASSSARASAGAARNFTPTGTVKARNALSDTSDNGGRRLGVGIGAVREIGQKLAADIGGESRGTRVNVGGRRVSSAV